MILIVESSLFYQLQSDIIIKCYNYILTTYGFQDAYFYYFRQRVYISSLDRTFFSDISKVNSLNKAFFIIKFVDKISSTGRLVYDYYSPYNTNKDVIFYPYNWFTKRFTYWNSSALIRSFDDYYHIFSCNYFPLGYVQEKDDIITSGGSNIVALDYETNEPISTKFEPNGLPYNNGRPFKILNKNLEGLAVQFTEVGGEISGSTINETGAAVDFTFSFSNYSSIFNNIIFFDTVVLLSQALDGLVITKNLKVDYIQTVQKAFIGATSSSFSIDYDVNPSLVSPIGPFTLNQVISSPPSIGTIYTAPSSQSKQPYFSVQYNTPTPSIFYMSFPINPNYVTKQLFVNEAKVYNSTQYVRVFSPTVPKILIERNLENENSFVPDFITNDFSQEIKPYNITNRSAISNFANEQYDATTSQFTSSDFFVTGKVQVGGNRLIGINFLTLLGVYRYTLYFTDSNNIYNGKQVDGDSWTYLTPTDSNYILIEVERYDGNKILASTLNADVNFFISNASFLPASEVLPASLCTVNRNRFFQSPYDYFLLRNVSLTEFSDINDAEGYFIFTDKISNEILLNLSTYSEDLVRLDISELGRDPNKEFGTQQAIFAKTRAGALKIQSLVNKQISYYNSFLRYNKEIFGRNFGVRSFYSIDNDLGTFLPFPNNFPIFESNSYLLGENFTFTSYIAQYLFGLSGETGPQLNSTINVKEQGNIDQNYNFLVQKVPNSGNIISIFSDENSNNGIRFFKEAFSFTNYLSQESFCSLIIALKTNIFETITFNDKNFLKLKFIYPNNLPNFPYISFNIVTSSGNFPSLIYSDLGVVTYEQYTPFYCQNQSAKKIFFKPWSKRNDFSVWVDLDLFVPDSYIYMMFSNYPSQLIDY